MLRGTTMPTAAITSPGAGAHRRRDRAQPGREFLVVQPDAELADPAEREGQLLTRGDGLGRPAGQIGAIEKHPQGGWVAVGQQHLAERRAVGRQPRADVQVQLHAEVGAAEQLRRRST